MMLSIALTVLFRHFSHQENLHHLSAVLLKLSFVLFFHLLCVCKIHRFMLSFHRALPPPNPHLLLNSDSGPNVAKPSSLTQRLATAWPYPTSQKNRKKTGTSVSVVLLRCLFQRGHTFFRRLLFCCYSFKTRKRKSVSLVLWIIPLAGALSPDHRL